MKFNEALAVSVETGIGIYRPTWNGNANRAAGVAQWCAPNRPREDDGPAAMHNPFMFISQANGRTPWVPSQGDLFAEDWETL